MFPLEEDGRYCSDNESHYIETWHAMEDLVDEGLCKSIGLSNFNGRQIREILQVRWLPHLYTADNCDPAP